MNKELLKLDDKGTYALMAPNKLIFLFEATEDEALNELETMNYQVDFNCKQNSIANIAFIPTFDCNLKCSYCYAKGGDTKEYLSSDNAFTALDYLKSTKKDCTDLNLFFVGGGEPLLNLSLVNEITNYSETLFKNVYIHVVTNGTFDNKTLNWLIDKKANVRISYDALGQENNRRFQTGKSSSNIVKNNIKSLVENNVDVIVQCVITNNMVNKMIECALDIYDLGIKYIKFEPALPTAVSRGNEDLSPNPIIFAENLLSTIKYIALNNLNLKIDTAYFSKPADGYYCGMGNGNLTVTSEGYIIPCVEVARKSDPFFDNLFLGRIENKKVICNYRNQEFLKSLHYKNYIGGCSHCKNRLICLGGCPMANIRQGGLPIKKSKYTCSIMNYFLPKILLEISRDERVLNILIEDPKVKKEV